MSLIVEMDLFKAHASIIQQNTMHRQTQAHKGSRSRQTQSVTLKAVKQANVQAAKTLLCRPYKWERAAEVKARCVQSSAHFLPHLTQFLMLLSLSAVVKPVSQSDNH